MDIAQLRYAQAVKRCRQIRDGNVNLADAKPESFRCKSVRRAYERYGPGKDSRRLKKVTPGMIDRFGPDARANIGASTVLNQDAFRGVRGGGNRMLPSI